MIALAALNLLADAAAERPLLLVADDVQWLDQPSQDVLTFIARRVSADPIVLMASVRKGHPVGLASAGLTELDVHGLDDTSARAVLAESCPGLSYAIRERILREALGRKPTAASCVYPFNGPLMGRRPGVAVSRSRAAFKGESLVLIWASAQVDHHRAKWRRADRCSRRADDNCGEQLSAGQSQRRVLTYGADQKMLPRGDLLPGLRRAAEGLIIPTAPVYPGRGPLPGPHVVSPAVPQDEDARGNNQQGYGKLGGSYPEAFPGHRQDGVHSGHHRYAHVSSPGYELYRARLWRLGQSLMTHWPQQPAARRYSRPSSTFASQAGHISSRYATCECPWVLPTADACGWPLLLLSSLLSAAVSATRVRP